jgi:hypothetical protein
MGGKQTETNRMVHLAGLAMAVNSHHSHKFSIIHLFSYSTIPGSLSLPKELLVYLRLPSRDGIREAYRTRDVPEG